MDKIDLMTPDSIDKGITTLTTGCFFLLSCIGLSTLLVGAGLAYYLATR